MKKNTYTLKLSVKSPTISPPIFPWYPQSKEILLNVGMKCWNSAFNAQGLRVIIVVVHIGLAEVQALRKKEPSDETQFTIEIGGKN